MKKFLIALATASALTVGVAAPASAQSWQTINSRQRSLDARIDAGVRSGQVTRAEAIRLRGEFRTLANLEARYRVTGGGLNSWERTDLNRRFDALSSRIRYERRDNDRYGNWQTINSRQRSLDARIDAGVRQGTINRREAILLRGEFRTLANLETRYRATSGGLSTWERQDLDRRFDALSARIRTSRR